MGKTKDAFMDSSLAEKCPCSTVSVLFGIFWLALLVGTPFFIESHEMPSVFSSAYAFIAVGLIAGVLLWKFVEVYAPRVMLKPLRAVLLAIGVAVTICLVVPEWYFHLRAFAGSALPMELIAPYVPFMVVFADIPSAPFGNLALLHHFLFLLMGLCCSYCLAAGMGRRAGEGLSGDERVNAALDASAGVGSSSAVVSSCEAGKPSAKSASTHRADLLVVGVFVCGFLHIGTWGWLAHVYGSNWSDAVMHDLLGFMGSTIIAIVMSALLAYLVCVGFRRLGVGLRLVLFSFAAGELSWNLFSRCGDAVSSILLFAPAASVLLLIVELLLFYLVRIGRGKSSGDDGDIVVEERDSKKGVAQLLDDANLADRERQAIELAIRGKNSAESAELIGVKASTVRTYLHRAYQKLGVSGLEELLAVVAGGKGQGSAGGSDCAESLSNQKSAAGLPCEGGPRGVVDASSCSEVDAFSSDETAIGRAEMAANTPKGVWGLASIPSAPLLVLLFGLFVLPHQYVGTVLSWGSSHSVVIGCGLGLMMSGGLLALLSKSGLRVRGGLWSSILFVVLFVASGCAFVGLQFLYAHGLLPLSKSAQLFFLGLTGLAFSFCLGLLTWFALRSKEAKTTPERSTPCVASLFALVFVLASYVNDYAWLTLCSFALVLGCLYLAVGARYTGVLAFGELTNPESARAFQDCLLCVGATVPFGVISGELWRGLQNPLLLGIYIVFLIVTCVLIFKEETRKLYSRKLSFGLFALILVLIAIAADVPHALLLLFLVFVLVGATSNQQSFVPFALCGFGLGLSFGRLGFDMWRDYLGTYFTTTESFGVNVATAALGPAFMVVVAVVGLACLLYLTSLYGASETSLSDSTKEERDVLLLRGKGINELEALVLVKIAEGMTGPQIARSLNYSLGAINSLRAHGYRTLDVHSKQELKALLDSMR